MNCKECREILVAYVDGALDAGRAGIEEHLAECVACRAEAQELRALHNRLVRHAENVCAGLTLEDTVLRRIAQEKPLKPRRVTMFRSIMRTFGPKAGLAAACAAIVVGIVLYMSGPSRVALADCLDKVAAVRSVRYTLSFPATARAIMARMRPFVHEIEVTTQYAPTHRKREAGDNGAVIITDYNLEKELILNPQEKKAFLASMPGLKDRKVPEDVFHDMTKLRGAAHEQLGRKEVDGRKTSGFRVNRSGSEEWTIWADEETGLPVRVEMKLKGPPGREPVIILSHFVFDEQLDESLFSLAVPEGYSVEEEIRDGAPKEADLIKTLQVTGVATDGIFPKEFDLAAIIKMASDAGKRGKSLNLGTARPEEVIVTLTKGFDFVTTLDPENDWHYVGGGVKVGAAEKPVCWWKPDGAKSYRVVYGDLTVRDVEPKDLPILPTK